VKRVAASAAALLALLLLGGNVLESGAGQPGSFDLNGNPTTYFGADSSTLQFTLPLATSGTYLDLAVDGAGCIYLLYYTSDGTQPVDYRVDVYTPGTSRWSRAILE